MNLSSFKNTSLYPFPNEELEKTLHAEIKNGEAIMGEEYPLLIGGEKHKAKTTFSSIDPCSPERAVGKFQLAGEKEAGLAVRAASDAFKGWRQIEAAERAKIFVKAARIAREERNHLIAITSLEVGKNWPEADGEICRFIDFLEFYARDIFSYMHGEKLPPSRNEATEYHYLPLGVGVVISPFNFPFALPAASLLAALICGNTVVWKPASDAAACAYRLYGILKQAGLPDGVLNIVTGSGETVGKYLVSHPEIKFIAFTGSADVGTEICELAARRHAGQKGIKRVVAEMGGKNAIFVDTDCDLDDAVAGVVHSAFGYQGQKCSAASRLILLSDNYDEVLEGLVKKTEALTIGPARENCQLNAVINENSFNKINYYIEQGKREGRLITGGETFSENGFYVKPTVFEGIKPSSPLNQKEIFGPVLSVLKAENLEEVLEIANGTCYGLTGSVYSNNPRVIAQAKAEWDCGNLFINRGCTGAPAGTHPFGGVKLSGTNTRVSGPNYLLNFLEDKFIATKYQ